MSEQAESRTTHGYALTVLVLGTGDGARACLSEVVVTASPAPPGAESHLHFTGAVRFARRTAQHLENVVTPLAQRILARLDQGPFAFQVGARNLAAASANQIPLEITGHSVDAPALLAMLGAALEMPVAEGVLATGHISCERGTIAAVSHLQAKFAAAESSGRVARLLYPDPQSDESFAALSPQQYQQAVEAVLGADPAIELHPVTDVNELVRAAFEERAVEPRVGWTVV